VNFHQTTGDYFREDSTLQMNYCLMISVCKVWNINILFIMCCLSAFNKNFSIGEEFPSTPVWRFSVPLKSRDS
jgi:hypothetical protein